MKREVWILFFLLGCFFRSLASSLKVFLRHTQNSRCLSSNKLLKSTQKKISQQEDITDIIREDMKISEERRLDFVFLARLLFQIFCFFKSFPQSVLTCDGRRPVMGLIKKCYLVEAAISKKMIPWGEGLTLRFISNVPFCCRLRPNRMQF